MARRKMERAYTAREIHEMIMPNAFALETETFCNYLAECTKRCAEWDKQKRGKQKTKRYAAK